MVLSDEDCTKAVTPVEDERSRQYVGQLFKEYYDVLEKSVEILEA